MTYPSWLRHHSWLSVPAGFLLPLWLLCSSALGVTPPSAGSHAAGEEGRAVAPLPDRSEAEKSVPSLSSALHHSDENVRASAAIALQRLGRRAGPARASLLAALWDGNWFVRRRAATTLGLLTLKTSDIPALVSVWQGKGRGPDDWDLISVMMATDESLAQNRGRLPDLFLRGLKTEDPRIRMNAVIALDAIHRAMPGEKAGRASLAALQRTEQDPDPRVRQRVAVALGSIERSWPRTARGRLTEFEQAREDDLGARYSFFPECGNPKRSSLMATRGNGVGELLVAMRDPTTRFIAAFTLTYSLSEENSFFYASAPKQQQVLLARLMEEQREIASMELLRLVAQGQSGRGGETMPALPMVRSNLDLRRAALFALGQLGSSTESTTKAMILKAMEAIAHEEAEDRELRWMAAVGLQKMGQPMAPFFQRLGMADPQASPSIRLQPVSQGDRFAPSLDFDIYAGQYIYNRRAPCGGGIDEIYNSLRTLMGNRHPSRRN